MNQPNHIATSKLSRLFVFSKFSLTLSLIITFFLSSSNLSAQFITTWKTTADGETITIPTNSIETYSYTVDWGDGNTTAGETGDATHTYLTAGEQTISITGLFPRIYFANGGDKDKIIAINHWGTNPWVSMYQAFFGCSNLAGQASDKPNLVGVTDFDHMFNSATSFNQDINNWDVSTIKSMNSMFNSASSFTSDLDNWDTGEVNDMTHMFNGATKFNGNISTWDVRKVETMHYMFNNTTVFDGDIGAWKTDALEGMSGMFYNAKAFNKYIGEWDVSRVTNMVDVFRGTDKYDKPLTNWDTGEVTKMRNMFRDAIAFNKDLSNFNTAKVKKMGEMFRGAIKFNGNIDNWDTGRVKHMGSMFSGAIAFNRDISGWNVSSVERMSYMFEGATSFNNSNTALTWTSGTSTSEVTTMKSMFKEATAFNQDISSWNVSLVDDMKTMFEKATAFNNGNAALTWTNGTGTSKVTKMNSMFKEATVFNQDISSWNVSLVDDMSFMFKDAAAFNNGNAALTWTNGTGTSRVTTLEQMFYVATAFNQDIGSWNVSEVQTMNNMFYQATSFNKDISSWNVSEVTDMTSMFYEATAFNNGNVALTWTNGTGTSNVTGMVYMFRNATSFNQDISSWNVSSVKKMSYMFQDATIFDQNLENWDVTGLTEAPGMFEDVKLLTDNYEKLLISWAAQNVNSGVVFSGGNSTYCSPESITAHTTLEGKWPAIIDGGNTGCTPVCTVPTIERDALMALYNSTDGANWTDNAKWNTAAPVKDWFGVTVDCATGTVIKLELQNNNLNGASITGNDIPVEIGNLISLDRIWLQNNKLTGEIPKELGNLTSLNRLHLNGNKLTGAIPNELTNTSIKYLILSDNKLFGSVPDFTNSSMNYLAIAVNAFEFGDFENEFVSYNTNFLVFSDNPQAKVDTEITLTKTTGETVTMEVNCSGNNNIYQWYKATDPISNGGDISGATTKTLTLANLKVTDAGIYHCKVTNTVVTDLTIERHDIILNISTGATQTYVPDDNFEQALIDLGYDSGSLDDYVPTANINAVTGLGVSGKSIADLTGIEDFIALENLNCSNNDLTSIDISNNTKLKSLICNTNQLTTINTDNNPDLWRIHTYGNPNLTTLDVTKNTELTDLQFTDCNVASIDLSQCTKLKDLFCGDNELTSLNLDNNIKLVRVGCYRNPIAGLNVTNNKELKVLRASNIATSAMDFSQNTKLKTLIIEHNGFSTLNLSTNVALEELNCQSNKNISILDLQNNVALKTLNCHVNKIQNLDLTNNIDLDYLSCGRNGMKTLTVAPGNRLTNVYCEDNQYTSLDFSQTTALSRFQFNKNPFLESVTLKNGNNTTIQDHEFDAYNCPKLTCIFVDDITYSTNTWSRIGANSTFVSTQADCDALSATDLTAFITTWKTTTANESITIPTKGGGYAYTVDWGDGSSDATVYTGDATHPYATAGNHTVSISDDFPRIYFNSKSGDNKEKIIDIKQWGNQKWTSMAHAFSGCSNLAGQASDEPELSEVEDLSYMFSSCIIFNQDIGNWNTSKVKTMSRMFTGASSFDKNIGNWNTSSVEDMSNMFASARKFNQDISTKASGAWNTSRVETMSWMFTGASDFDKNIGNWNTSNVENMASMFQNASKFNGNIGSWNTTKVTTMKSMFFNATNFKQDISYKAATATTTEAWNTSAVTSMRSMFMNAVNFNQNIGNWNTGAVTDMTEMFYRAIKFDQNLENWNVEGLVNTGTSFGAESMFRKVKLSTTNYDALLKSWSIQNLNPNVNFSGGLSQYCTAETERAILDGKWGDITDKGKDPNCGVATDLTAFITTWKTTTANESITIPTLSTAAYNYTVDWGDSSTDATTYTGNATHPYAIAGNHIVKITGLFPQIHFGSPNTTATNREKIIEINQWGTNPWSSMISAFKNCTNLEGLAIDKPILTNVTDIHAMFYGCSKFNQNINDWDVSTIENMSFMFSNAHIFDQPLNGWDVSHVKFMQNMFGSALKFKQDLNLWETKEVTNMHEMFQSAWDFNGDITTWNTAKVKDMSNMFRLTKVFNRNIGNWNTNEVTDMSGMFDGAKKFDKDISTKASGAWNTSKVRTMQNMFSGAVVFNQDIGNWQTGEVTEMQYMFYNAKKFSKYIGDWNTSKVENMRQMLYHAEAFDQDISYKSAANPIDEAWNTSKVSSMNGMFEGAVIFNGNIGNWKTEAVMDMSRMFINAKKFTQDLPWDVSSVKKMTAMFAGAEIFDGDITQWKTTNVDDMDAMFQSATAFNRDISFKLGTGAWNTGNVTNMSSMFNIATSFDKNIGNWNTEKVTNMYRMFDRATSFDQNLANWNVEAIVNASLSGADLMFKDVKLSTANYDALLKGWSAQNLNPDVKFDGGLSQYCNAETERAILETKWGTITDAGKDSNCGVANLDCPTISMTNTTNVSLTPTITWNDITGAIDYHVSIIRTSDGVEVYSQNNITGTSHTINTALDNNTTYTVTVFASNAAGESTGCTPIDFKTEIASSSIACPDVTFPLEGTADVVVNPTIIWKEVFGAVGYRVSIGDSPGTANILNIELNASQLSYTLTTPLDEGTTYFLTVSAKDAIGESTGCTEISFTTEVTLPNCTQLSFPSNGATGVPLNASLTWLATSASNATGFRISIGTSVGGVDIENKKEMFNATSYIPNQNWQENKTYFVTLFPYNSVGETTGCLETTFKTGTTNVIDCPILTFPNPGETGISLNPTITWNRVTGATGYRVTIGTSVGGAEITDTSLGNVLNFELITTSLAENTIYFVTVFAIKGTEESEGCQTTSFTTKVVDDLPDCPTLTFPTAGETGISLNPTITWNRVTNATGYRVTIGTSTGGAEITDTSLGDVLSFELIGLSLANNKTYFITVYALKGTEESTGCLEISFTTVDVNSDVPSCPTLTFPIAGETEVSVTPIITWNTVTDATGYRIIIGTSIGGTQIIEETLGKVLRYKLTATSLAENTIYFVTVYALKGTEESTGCFANSFTTEGSPLPVNTDIPHFFTPNNDSFNDYWQVKDPQNKIKLIQVFDRYSKLISQFDAISLGWDGNYMGNPMPNSDYWYVITYNSGKPLKGHFSLIRR